MTQSAIGGLVMKALRNKNFLQELIADRDSKEQTRQRIADVVREMNGKDEFIDSVAHV